jgi:hypothetical protein
MSASSIAQVCGIPRSQVLEILKDIFVAAVRQKDHVSLDLRVGELHITEKNELYFKNKTQNERKDRKQELIQAINDANDSYFDPKPNVTYDVNKIASDVLSMHSGLSYYVSVKTPRTKTRSVISSKYGTGNRRKNKFSFFKKNSE